MASRAPPRSEKLERLSLHPVSRDMLARVGQKVALSPCELVAALDRANVFFNGQYRLEPVWSSPEPGGALTCTHRRGKAVRLKHGLTLAFSFARWGRDVQELAPAGFRPVKKRTPLARAVKNHHTVAFESRSGVRPWSGAEASEVLAVLCAVLRMEPLTTTRRSSFPVKRVLARMEEVEALVGSSVEHRPRPRLRVSREASFTSPAEALMAAGTSP